ncbi:30S ribosomal protein S13 [Candidatus Nomurabacteria bacterium RIFCSPLOWO2_02_FULL_42_17]|uniref:Small ribosomal subunit protein uS13 n=2 Tax=Candidatus Nomuraibacteriota TaxID=1752729 RepID=A0A1F6WHY8_9BACT|nr:MAG: 30S ribosomal protein S13 [Parcubacteria group bacterium GW2011_GWA2_42_18]OGI81508.1 MAG: 30S ribosomal protein S13 [Candidatus Nomurabacteria bacterium RIFCSPHIGHO2_02_FULL_42_24]OGI96895.1 MAG: 30S ribosomal protein S13 [Candidatus Nomurabacteria bacterium RIFCSPLOWO2_02_FULL_42_17]
MRIAGINIPNEKQAQFGLTAIYGIGLSTARQILTLTGINPQKKVKDINAEEENNIRKAVEGFKIEGVLKRKVSGDIKRLREIKSYRGSRHTKRLPVRGQRTKTNSRTIRGNVRKTMASGRRTAEKT